MVSMALPVLAPRSPRNLSGHQIEICAAYKFHQRHPRQHWASVRGMGAASAAGHGASECDSLRAGPNASTRAGAMPCWVVAAAAGARTLITYPLLACLRRQTNQNGQWPFHKPSRQLMLSRRGKRRRPRFSILPFGIRRSGRRL